MSGPGQLPPDQCFDKTVAVVTFTTPSGEPIAAYANYAMHPVNGYLVGITSADFPGAASRYVEQQFDDKMVLVWTQGASGDQNPLLLRPATNALASKAGVKITGYDLVREKVEAPLREGEVPQPDRSERPGHRVMTTRVPPGHRVMTTRAPPVLAETPWSYRAAAPAGGSVYSPGTVARMRKRSA